MIRLAVAVCVYVALLAGMSAVFSADATPEKHVAKSYSSPQEAFNAWRAAMEKHDWRTAFLSETPSARNAEVFALFVECGMKGGPKVQALLKKFGVEDASGQLNAEYDRRYKEKHGVDIGRLTADRKAKEDKLTAEFFKKRAASGIRDDPNVAVPVEIDESQLGPPLPPTNEALARAVVVDSISDKVGFFLAAHDALGSAGGANPKIGPLERVNIKGDTAEGVLNVTSSIVSLHVDRGVESKHVHSFDTKITFRFVKTANGWLKD
jgi:hypothetical protein